MTYRELSELAARNPLLCITVDGKKIPVGSLISQRKDTKYRNIKCYVYADGYVGYGEKRAGEKPVAVYDSVKEYERGRGLELLQRSHQISDLKRQVPLEIQPAMRREGTLIRAVVYRADYCYQKAGKTIVEDVKPLDKKTGKYRLTKDFTLKWKLLQALHPDWVFKIY